MRRIADSIGRGIPGARVSPSTLHGENCVTKLIVRADGVQIKIEVTPVLRGCVYEPAIRSVSALVENRLKLLEIQVVNFRTFMRAKVWRPSTASTRAICLTCGICWREALTITCETLSSTFSATIDRWQKSLHRRASTFRRSSPEASTA